MPKAAQAFTRSVCAAVACVVLVASVPAAAQGAAPAKCTKPDQIRVMVFASLFLNMVSYIAKDAGLFDRYCLNATLVPVQSGPAGMAQLQAGSLTFSDSSVDNTIVARHRGLPIKIVTAESSADPYSLVARPGVADPAAGYPAAMKSLAGKKVGVFALGTGSELFVKQLLRGAGVDPKKVTMVAVGSAPSQFAALENKSVDAVIMADPAQDLAVHSDLGKILVDLRKPGVGPAAITALSGTFQVKVASEDYIAKHPDIVRRYVDANRATVDWIRDPKNRNQLYAYMKAHVSFGREVADADAVFRKLVDHYADASTVVLSKKSIAGWNDLQMKAGNIPAPVKWSDLVWSAAPQAD